MLGVFLVELRRIRPCIIYAHLTAYNAIARGEAECKLMQQPLEARASAIIAVTARGEAEFNNWCNRIILTVRFTRYYATRYKYVQLMLFLNQF